MRRPCGFTLLETVVAAAVLLSMCLVATSALLLAGRLQARAASVARGQVSGRALLESMRWAPLLAGDESAEGVIDTYFPHAVTTRNAPAAEYVPEHCDGLPAGSFATIAHTSVGDVRVVAAFARSTREGFLSLGPDQVSGYDGSRADPLPGACLLIVAAAGWSEGQRAQEGAATCISPPLSAAGSGGQGGAR